MFPFGNDAKHLIALQQETNSLLRELIQAVGRAPRTPRTGLPSPPQRVRTGQDVVVAGRKAVLEHEREEIERLTAPWRSGPDSDPTVESDGSAPASDSRDAPRG